MPSTKDAVVRNCPKVPYTERKAKGGSERRNHDGAISAWWPLDRGRLPKLHSGAALLQAELLRPRREGEMARYT
jgi:hypothetical protein